MSDKEKQINDAKQELYRSISDVKKYGEKINVDYLKKRL